MAGMKFLTFDGLLGLAICVAIVAAFAIISQRRRNRK
jgi:hypothetical protein